MPTRLTCTKLSFGKISVLLSIYFSISFVVDASEISTSTLWNLFSPHLMNWDVIFLSSISRQCKKFKVIILFDESYKDEVKTQLLKEFDNIFEISYKKSERDDSLGKFVIKISIIENNAINIVYERLAIIKQIETITVSEIYE